MRKAGGQGLSASIIARALGFNPFRLHTQVFTDRILRAQSGGFLCLIVTLNPGLSESLLGPL